MAAFYNYGQVEEDEVSNARLKQLVSKQPVGVAIHSSSGLMSYSKGVLTNEFLNCSTKQKFINHGVLLVGYGKTSAEDLIYSGLVKQTCEEYWIVRNSWGERWGENGFFRLCMDNAGSPEMPEGICHINSYAQYPIATAEDVP